MPRTIESKRQRLERLRVNLETERDSFISHWRDLGDYLLPRRPRWVARDVNRGDRRNLKIYDGTGGLALRTLQSGLMSGITSPAKPWFRLGIEGLNSIEPGPAQMWLKEVTDIMHSIFIRSNLYNCLPTLYGDIGAFGTGCMSVEEDFDSVIHCNVFPIGSYCISADDRGRVDTFCRKYAMTVRNLVSKFGIEKFSDGVKTNYDRNNL